MLGAIIGDIVGSVYEFQNHKSKEFPLLLPKSRYTDDTVLTLATEEILQNGWAYDRKKVAETFKKWANTYGDAGYGEDFFHWVRSDGSEPYYSHGNGAAMRISPVGYYAQSEEEVKCLSKAITEVTHNHEEGIKGAEVTAMAVYYGRIGKNKEFIREYAEKQYSLNFDLAELQRTYGHTEELCETTVPQALFCFFISKDFEDCLRTSVSIGGDTDTLCAISMAVADAFYQPNLFSSPWIEVLSRMPESKGSCHIEELLEKHLIKRYEKRTL